MESSIHFLIVVFCIAVIANLIMQYIDLRLKSYAIDMFDEFLEKGKPQNILITEGQANAIAKLVKNLMEKESDTHDKKGE